MSHHKMQISTGFKQSYAESPTSKFNATKVRSLFKDGRQTAGCTNFYTETRLLSPVSVRNSVHPAVCLPSLKRKRTLHKKAKQNRKHNLPAGQQSDIS